jgi:4-amino-4-deoxy-L-arabinose transferase-like glycosyltransferase
VGPLRNVIILCVVGLLFLVLGNHLLPLTDPDEVFYALSGKEMAQHHSWMVPYLFGQPQFEKPILTFWLLRLSYLVFGINNFAARFPPALFGILGALTLYRLGLVAFRDKGAALLSAFVLMSSILYLAMSRFVFTDMVFSVLVLMSLTAFYTGYVDPEHKARGLTLGFTFAGLAVLTKGLLGIVFPMGTVLLFLALRRDIRFLATRHIAYGACIFAILTVPWYWYMIDRYGDAFIHEFFYNDHIRRVLEAEHKGNDTWFFYPGILLFGLLPWSVPLVAGLIKLGRDNPLRRSAPQASFLLAWVVSMLAVLQIAHSKLASYILPAIPALALVTGGYIQHLLTREKRRKLQVMIGLSSLSILAIPTLLMLVATGAVKLDFNYYELMPDKRTAVTLAILSAAIAGATLLFVFRNRPRWSIYTLGAQLPFLFLFIMSMHGNFENFVSSQNTCKFLVDQPNVGETILCSKMLARGVRYYTGRDVAIVGDNFFSPHPVTVVDTDDEIRQYLSKGVTTYAVVRATQYKRLKQLSQNRFQFDELLHQGDAYVVRISSAE